MAHAVRLVQGVCSLAGSYAFVDELRNDLGEGHLQSAVENHDTAALYDWLVSTFSYQGIADDIASNYMNQHGRVSWYDVHAGTIGNPACPKLTSYWHFHGCGYEKTAGTCSHPERIGHCPVPTHPLRNGRLNQMAYSLFLFIRDIADGDLVAWIDRRMAETNDVQVALIEPLRNVYAVSDKVLLMAFSGLMMGMTSRPDWVEAGSRMIVIDTLVHNFLHRTGILHRFEADHPYGPACYQPNGCADILRDVADRIDARQFNRSFPAAFPRFVQHAIWRYCAQQGRGICNGNRIDDRHSCENRHCQLYGACDRLRLKKAQ